MFYKSITGPCCNASFDKGIITPPGSRGNLLFVSMCVFVCEVYVCVSADLKGYVTIVDTYSHILHCCSFCHIHCSVLLWAQCYHCEQVWFLEAVYYWNLGMFYRLSDYKPVRALRDYFKVLLLNIKKTVTYKQAFYQFFKYHIGVLIIAHN